MTSVVSVETIQQLVSSACDWAVKGIEVHGGTCKAWLQISCFGKFLN